MEARKFEGEVTWVWLMRKVAAGPAICKRVFQGEILLLTIETKELWVENQTVLIAVAFLPNKFGQKSSKNMVSS